jgi:hypothetical protein
LFVQALPNAYRARGFGVMKGGIQVLQGTSVFVTGALADRFELSAVVGAWGILGVGLMAVAVLTWPDARTISAEIERVHNLNAADAEAARTWRAPSPGPTARHTRPVPAAMDVEPVNGAEPGGSAGHVPTHTLGAAPVDGVAVGRARVEGGPATPEPGPGVPTGDKSRNAGPEHGGPEQHPSPRPRPGRHRAASV